MPKTMYTLNTFQKRTKTLYILSNKKNINRAAIIPNGDDKFYNYLVFFIRDLIENNEIDNNLLQKADTNALKEAKSYKPPKFKDFFNA